MNQNFTLKIKYIILNIPPTSLGYYTLNKLLWHYNGLYLYKESDTTGKSLDQIINHPNINKNIYTLINDYIKFLRNKKIKNLL